MAVVDERTATQTESPGTHIRVPGDPPRGSSEGAQEEVTISLVETVHKLVSSRRLMMLASLAGLLLGVIVYLLTPAYFVAEASFLPPQQQQQSPLSALSAVFQAQSQVGTSDTYLALLQSRSVSDDVVDQLHLMQRFQTKSRVGARGQLNRMSKFKLSKNELITVTIKSKDPGLSSDIANAFLEALYRQNGLMVTSASSHREQFFRGQLQQQKEEVETAESDLRQTQEKTGLVLPEGEATAGIAATAQLQQQINLAETRLSGLLAGATEQNPEVVEARQELGTLRAALARQQAAAGHKANGLPSASQLPALAMENLRRQRELKLQETLYASLTEQYERARLSSVDPGPQLQIVDRAVRPEFKAGPNALLYAVGGALLGFFLAFGGLLLSGSVSRFLRSYQGLTRARVPAA